MSRSLCSVRGSRWSLGGVTWPTAEITPWNFGVFTTETKSSGPGQTQLEAAGGLGLVVVFWRVIEYLQDASPLLLGPSEPWREKWGKEVAGKITKAWSIWLRNHPKDKILFLVVVSGDPVEATLQLLPLPAIPGTHGPRDVKSSSPLATGWKKHFCCSRGLESSIQEWQSLHPVWDLPHHQQPSFWPCTVCSEFLSFTAWCASSL